MNSQRIQRDNDEFTTNSKKNDEFNVKSEKIEKENARKCSGKVEPRIVTNSLFKESS